MFYMLVLISLLVS